MVSLAPAGNCLQRIAGEGFSYQVQARSTTEILHHYPQLVSLQEAGLVVGNERTGAGAEHRNLLLYIFDIIFA